jgi:hypothetical protein
LALHHDESHAEWRYGHSSCAVQRKSVTTKQTSNYLELPTAQLHHVTGDDDNHTYCIEELRELGEVVPPATSDHLQQSQQLVPDIA